MLIYSNNPMGILKLHVDIDRTSEHRHTHRYPTVRTFVAISAVGSVVSEMSWPRHYMRVSEDARSQYMHALKTMKI
jgi:hypothetical protein